MTIPANQDGLVFILESRLCFFFFISGITYGTSTWAYPYIYGHDLIISVSVLQVLSNIDYKSDYHINYHSSLT